MRALLLTLAFVLALTGVASAQPGTPRGAQKAHALANKAMKRGAELAESGDDVGALAEFERAQGLVPSANLPWRYAAESLERLKRHDEAIAAYNRYLSLKPDVKDGPLVLARIAALERERSRGSLAVVTTPPGAAVYVDDEPRGSTPSAEISVLPGDHRVRLEKAGFDAVVVTIHVEPRERVPLEKELVRAVAPPPPSPVAPAPPASAKAAPGTSPGSSTRTWGHVALGTGAALLAGAVASDVFLLGDARRDFDRAREAGDGTALDESSRVETTRAAVFVGYATAVTALVAGAVLVVWPRAEKAPVEVRGARGGSSLTIRF